MIIQLPLGFEELELEENKKVNFVLLSDIGKLIFDVNVPNSNILKAFEYYGE